MMPYIIIPKIRKFHKPTANCFGTARQKPIPPPLSLNRVKVLGVFTCHTRQFYSLFALLSTQGILLSIRVEKNFERKNTQVMQKLRTAGEKNGKYS